MRIGLVIVVFAGLTAMGALAEPAATGILFDVTLSGKTGPIETREVNEITWFDGRWMEKTEAGMVLIDLKNFSIHLVDHSEKIYTGGPAEAFLQELETVMKQDVEALKETCPKSGQAAAGKPAAQRKVRTEMIGQVALDGTACRHYRILAGTELKEELWVNPAIMPSAYFDVSLLFPLLTRLESITGSIAEEFRSPADSVVEQAIAVELAKLFCVGLEMKSREYSRGAVLYEKRVSNIRSFYGDESVFRVPEGYKKVGVRDFVEASSPSPVDFSDPNESEKH